MIDKIAWQNVGCVSEPGRYIFTFGWLTITAEDIGVWERFPEARFTLVKFPNGDAAANEFHLGAFEIPLTGKPEMASRGEALAR